jgi:hypothetical protein
MAVYEYKIATEAEGVEGLKNVEDELAVGLPPPHPVRPTEWATTYEGMDGQQHGDGYPSQVWPWTYLSQAMYNVLRAYCTGKSATVYIRTRKVDGSGDWANYKAIMVWPTSTSPNMGVGGLAYRNFELEFTFMEEQ